MEVVWKPEYFEFVLALANVTIGFVAYFFISESKKAHRYFKEKYGEEKTKIYFIFFQRYTGVVCLGLFPLITTLILIPKSIADYGLSFQNFLISVYWSLGLGMLILVINFLNSRKADNLAIYPQIRVKEWSANLIFFNALSWCSYLFAYELLFRGFLLFGTASLIGAVPAIAINASIYSIAHIPKGIKETIGAIPLGIILCLITFSTGTIWVAFFVHITLALSNDSFSLYFHPEMKLKR